MPIAAGGVEILAPVSVIVPTVGRPTLLAEALASIARCDPQPADVVIVDQSVGDETRRVVAETTLTQARLVRSRQRGIGAATNAGLRAADHDTVFLLHDDCTAEPGWIRAGLGAMEAVPGGLASGQVLPVGPDPRAVPSCIAFDEVREHSGTVSFGVLYPNNMVGSRSRLLEIGGFDERIRPAAEDGDLCYRWLRAGRPLRQIPDMVVHHRDWRSHDELPDVYVGYYRGQGMFYAKHLRAGDLTMLRFVGADSLSWLRSLLSRWVYKTPRWADPRRGIGAGLPRGLWAGWRAFR